MLLELKNITKSYGPIQSLRGVNLTLNAGEVLGLVGDNGAGKSTLMKVVSGAVVPDSGEYLLESTPMHFRSPQEARGQRIEMVYQDLSLCDTMDVAKNLFLGREPLRNLAGLRFVDHQTLHSRAQKILDDLKITVPSTRAVSFSPKILILDEPTAALAVKEVNEVLELIGRLKAQGVGIILISHRLQDIMQVTDRIMVMYEGQNVAERTTKETTLEDIIRLIVRG
jgi:simple sugar transport system ATP-binding protein